MRQGGWITTGKDERQGEGSLWGKMRETRGVVTTGKDERGKGSGHYREG